MSVIFPWPVLVLVLLLLSVVFCLALLTAYSQHGVTPQNGLGYDSQALKYEDRGIAFLSPHELPESQPPSTEISHHWQVPNPACFLDEDKVVRCNQLQGKNMTYSYKDDTSGSMDEGPPPREFKPLPKWRRGKDMPIEMSTSVQSVVIGDTVYVGGGFADNVHEECTVMKLEQDQWIKLPEYTAKYFAMTSLSNRLVLVGGRDTRNNERTNQLAVFESGEWSHPYPLMNIARSSSTAVSFNNHIIVAGGYDDKKQILSSVEVLDVASGKWYSAQSLPNPRSILKSTIIGNTLYIMGGWDDKSGTKTVLHVDLNHLIASNLNTPTLWQKIEDTSLLYSTPLSIGRLLLAIGGQDEEGNPSSSIHLYQPDTKWVKVGDLPTARYFCTCSVLSNEEVIVAGGRDEHGFIDTVDFFLLH